MDTPEDSKDKSAPNGPVTSARPDPLTQGQTVSGQPAPEQAAPQDPVSAPDVSGQDQPGSGHRGQDPEHDAFSFSGREAAARPVPVSAMNIGSVLTRSLAALRANPAVFLGLGLLSAIPSCFLLMLFPSGDVAELLVRVVGFICGLVVQGGTAYALVRMLLGGTATLGEAIGRGMTRIGPLAGTALLMGIGTAFGLGLFLLPGLFLCVYGPWPSRSARWKNRGR